MLAMGRQKVQESVSFSRPGFKNPLRTLLSLSSTTTLLCVEAGARVFNGINLFRAGNDCSRLRMYVMLSRNFLSTHCFDWS